jgi:aminoglycoside phosphotransferase (APT) family kinase protein
MTAHAPTDSSPDSEVLQQLESFIRARLGPTATVEGFSRVATGKSRQNWLFDAVWHDGESLQREPLIVRRNPLGGLLDTDRADEFAMLRALEAAAIPTPQVRWLDAHGEELGRPCLVMVRITGSCDYYALNGPAPLQDRVDLAKRLCSLLADVHAVDWQAIGLGDHFTDPGPKPSLVALDEWEAVLRRDQLEPYPELALGAKWLRAKAPRSPRNVLVHADFKVGNVLLDDAGEIVALLDWELAHLGDPHEDLGWVTQPLRAKEHRIPGSWEPADLLAHYEQASGRTVDTVAVMWWNVFSAFKTAVMQASGLKAFLEGRSDEHYQPSAPVLMALLRAVTRADSPSAPGPGDRVVFADRASFLAWENEELAKLLPSAAMAVGADSAATNRLLREALVELINALPDDPGSKDVASNDDRQRIGSHLIRRVASDPALARRKS